MIARSAENWNTTSALSPLVQYTARIVGGAGGVKDSNGGTLANNFTWVFTKAQIYPVGTLFRGR